MTAGFQFLNPSNKLTVSSDGKGLCCIGKAIPVSIEQATGSATGNVPGRLGGYSIYHVSHPDEIILAVDTPLNKKVGILNVVNIGNNIWEITAYCGSNADEFLIDSVQEYVDIWAYGVPTTPLNTWGMEIYSTDGTLAYDLSQQNLLFPRAYVTSMGETVSIPSLVRPVVLGASATVLYLEGLVSTNRYSVGYYRDVWLRNGAGTSLSSTRICMRRYEYSASEPQGLDGGDVFRANAFIIEGNTLP